MSKIRHWKYIKPQIALPKLKKIRSISGWVKFDEKYPYDTGDNQKDWNKLLGIKISLFGQHRESIMIGHRWDPRLKKVQLIPYFHFTGNNESEIFNAQQGLKRVGSKNAWVLPDWLRNFDIGEECDFHIGLEEHTESYFAQIGNTPYASIDHEEGFYEGYKIKWMDGWPRASSEVFLYQIKINFRMNEFQGVVASMEKELQSLETTKEEVILGAYSLKGFSHFPDWRKMSIGHESDDSAGGYGQLKYEYVSYSGVPLVKFKIETELTPTSLNKTMTWEVL